ncbi:cell division protein ZapA [Alkalicoccobacillus plakortidis]|uniref:Cell division protein ZapA n=1 Tax=Alkalicoccobacillus plakortidis TaxID=444060 RepID=A0ABT0XH59_9BACI|nr:cell division protein ZapA [Alkalicoccobacillus plakortidis]MCM2675236.1 cell division protein ZapA [Alkalicoccobacillus plakortidis]
MANQNDKKQRTTVSIYGQQYTIVGQEDPAHVKEVVRYVDEQMREMKRKNPYLDTTRLAVLTAVNAVSEYKKLEKQARSNESHSKEN